LHHDTPVKVITVVAAALTDDGWGPFGWLPVDDLDPRDADHDLHFEWADPHLNVISHHPDEVEWSDAGPQCAVMYRHLTHTQALVPLDVASVIAVAPATVDFSEPEHVEQVRAFALEPLDALVLARGTWHWGPFPVGPEPVRMLNVQGARYAEDNTSVDLRAHVGAVVEIVTT
jgi:ureidoglycolate hydrolase